MAHLAAGTCLMLAIEMQMGGGIGQDSLPIFGFCPNEVAHFHALDREPCVTQRQAADGADVIFELTGYGAFDGPVPAIVDAGAISLKTGPSALAKNSSASTPT